MIFCFMALILASYFRHIRDTRVDLARVFPLMPSILEKLQTFRYNYFFEIPKGCRPTYTSRKLTKSKPGHPIKPKV